MPLVNLIRDTAHAVVEALGLEQKDVVVEDLARAMAARNPGNAIGRQFASAERSPARDILPQDRDDPEQSASSRTEGERERQTKRCR